MPNPHGLNESDDIENNLKQIDGKYQNMFPIKFQ